DEAVLDTGRLADGTLVGAPLGIGIFSVGVNTALLEQAGIELPDDTSWTWEELSELSQQVGEWADEAGEDVVGLDFFGTSAAELGPGARKAAERLFLRKDEKCIWKETMVYYLEYSKARVDDGAPPGPPSRSRTSAPAWNRG